MTTTRTNVASVIWSQISTATKMACGLRGPTAVTPTELCCKALSRNRWVLINLDPSDTYTVRLVRQHKTTFGLITIETVSDVFCDGLSEVVYNICNK